MSVSHHIFLTREERYKLANGESIETIGVSVPVWFYKQSTSEPANEVFCKYVLTNSPEDFPVTTLSSGYKINIPQIPKGCKSSRMPFEEWESLTLGEQEKWARNHIVLPSGIDLLDPEDNGNSALVFKRYSKIKEGKKRINEIHIVEINALKMFYESLCF